MTIKTASNDRKILGFDGEDCAASYLQSLGWQIVARNWRCELGEIDICCLEPRPHDRPIAVIVEVKTRSGRGYGHPLEAITAEKARRLKRLAARWAAETDTQFAGLRVDAVGVVKLAGMRPQIEHVRGIQ